MIDDGVISGYRIHDQQIQLVTDYGRTLGVTPPMNARVSERLQEANIPYFPEEESSSRTNPLVWLLPNDAQTLVDEGFLKAQTVRDHVRLHRVFGWYFLPAGDLIPESIVDLRDLHTIPRDLLEETIHCLVPYSDSTERLTGSYVASDRKRFGLNGARYLNPQSSIVNSFPLSSTPHPPRRRGCRSPRSV